MLVNKEKCSVMSNKCKVLISTTIVEFNNRLLKKMRLSRAYGKSSFRKNMSKPQVGKKVGVSGNQIGRYETDKGKPFRQLPRLLVFKRLCLLYQVDPKDLLGLVWVDKKLINDDFLTLDVEKEMIVPIRFCNKCKQLLFDSEQITKKFEKEKREKNE